MQGSCGCLDWGSHISLPFPSTPSSCYGIEGFSFMSCCLLQALSLKEAEKNLLSEKLSEVQRELANTKMEIDRVKLEALNRQEQDKVSPDPFLDW